MTTIPMDIGVVIVRQKESGGALTHFATLFIGRPDIQLKTNEKEVFRCNAAGRNFFSCIAALKERSLAWATLYDVKEITGLTNEEDCLLTLHTPSGEKTIITPVTYNDWILEVHL